MAEYGRPRILALIDCVADAFRVKRSQKADLVERVNAYAAELNAH
jgi:hypothetical protein